MPTYKRTDTGSWTTIVYLGKASNGKKKYKRVTAPTRKQLAELVRKTELTYMGSNLDVKDRTVGELVTMYIERLRNDSTKSPSTVRGYITDQRNSFQRLQSMQLSKVTDFICQQEIDAMAQQMSPKTLSNRWGLIRTACCFYDKTFNPRVKLPKVIVKDLEMPDEQNLIGFLQAIEGKNLEIPVLLGMSCGLRRSEISALDLNADIDYDKGVVSINKAMVINENGNYVVKDVPKTQASVRLVPVPDAVLEKLDKARKDPDFVLLTPNTITTKFHYWAKKYNINCSFHGLRHYYASVMASLNVPDKYAMERMGHTTRYMLMRYQEYLRHKEVEVNKSLTDHFNKILGQE